MDWILKESPPLHPNLLLRKWAHAGRWSSSRAPWLATENRVAAELNSLAG
jgi:hypothetical protein